MYGSRSAPVNGSRPTACRTAKAYWTDHGITAGPPAIRT